MALSQDDQNAIVERTAAAVEQLERVEHALKTFLGDEDGTDERVALFDKTNGLYAKVTALDAKLDKIIAKVGA